MLHFFFFLKASLILFFYELTEKGIKWFSLFTVIVSDYNHITVSLILVPDRFRDFFNYGTGQDH